MKCNFCNREIQLPVVIVLKFPGGGEIRYYSCLICVEKTEQELNRRAHECKQKHPPNKQD